MRKNLTSGAIQVPEMLALWANFGTPVSTAALSALAAWLTIRFDTRKTINQELVKKRLGLYEEIVPKVNDILCFFTCLGGWKSLSPETLVEYKRQLDRLIYIFGPLLSEGLLSAYHGFIDACFLTFRGAGQPAVLRAHVGRLKRQWLDSWMIHWDDFFCHEDQAVDIKLLKSKYEAFTAEFAAEIGIRRPWWHRQ